MKKLLSIFFICLILAPSYSYGGISRCTALSDHTKYRGKKFTPKPVCYIPCVVFANVAFPVVELAQMGVSFASLLHALSQQFGKALEQYQKNIETQVNLLNKIKSTKELQLVELKKIQFNLAKLKQLQAAHMDAAASKALYEYKEKLKYILDGDM